MSLEKIMLMKLSVCFEEFYESKKAYYDARANVLRILTDTESNVHYNLHGSAYWKVLPTDKSKLPNPEIVLGEGIHLASNDEQSTLQIEKGKTLFVSNIITGFQKSQRTVLTPFRQMQSAFDKDCLTADKITIVGYSFNDEHINEALKTALRYNENLTLEIIDPSFIENEMDLHFALKFFPFVKSRQIKPKKISENYFSYFDNKFKVFTVRFSDFLSEQAL